MTALNLHDGGRYYHGTSPSSAICILQEGFRVPDRGFNKGGALGTGIYVTRNLNEAIGFGGVTCFVSTYVYVLELEFARGTKIARFDEEDNKQVLDSLRREFGHEVLGPGFVKAIPRNKHLKPRELFALINSLEGSGALYEPVTKRRVRRWLQRLGYHGYGHTHNDLGVMLFDPSRLLLHDVKQLRHPKQDLFSVCLDQSALLPLNPLDVTTDADAQLQFIEANIRDDDEDPEYQSDLESDIELQSFAAAERSDLERRRTLLSQYKKRHGLVTDTVPTAE